MAVSLNTEYLKDFIDESEYSAIDSQVRLVQALLRSGAGEGHDYVGWVDLPDNYDREEVDRIKKAAEKIRSDSDVLVVIGIGGSYLGARGVIELLGSQYFNDFSDLKVYFAGNTLSGDALKKIIRLCEGKRISLNVISKSGTTTESSIAFRIFRAMLEKQYGKQEAASRIYATTDKARGTLKKLADKEGYETFVIPDDVGGRYSVLTPVGLLPIAAAGFDIDALLAGAQNGKKRFSGEEIGTSDALKYAAIRNILSRKGKSIELTVSFEPAFTMMNEWLKQLYGESEGKQHKGLFPASCIFSTDLHSMGQYIQDGARQLFETFIRFGEAGEDVEVPYEIDDSDELNFIAGKNLSYVNDKALKATEQAHVSGGVPCIEINVDRIDEENLGELIYFFELTCGISGYLLGVNPFNQPGVEAYKKNMFKLLGKPGYTD
ncbi:MAG: glucose-6-phosphate isomerase [Oscillospiraceae bacterium]|nr:glucose-6-phosphate isomerase [Oscillospiraceae bacterium]